MGGSRGRRSGARCGRDALGLPWGRCARQREAGFPRWSRSHEPRGATGGRSRWRAGRCSSRSGCESSVLAGAGRNGCAPRPAKCHRWLQRSPDRLQEVGQHGPLPFVGGALQQLQLVEARRHHVIVGHQRPDPACRAAARIPEHVHPHGRINQGRHERAASPRGRSPDAASLCRRGPENPSFAVATAAPARSARDAPAPAWCAGR